MNKLHGWWLRLRRALHPRAFDQQMADEMREHLEREAGQREARGEDPEAARRHAALAFGHAVSIQEQIRDRRLAHEVDVLFRDIRQAIRVLRHAPGFTFIAVTTLALCLGANVTLFSLLRSIVLRPYPYPGADRVVNLGMVWPKWPWGELVQEISPLTFLEIEESARSYSALGFIDGQNKADLHLGDRTLRLDLARVTPGVWDVAQVAPVIGRVFDTADVEQGEGEPVVLSDALWRDLYQRDPAVIGRELRVDDRTCRIIGVMPADFSLASNRARLWLPRVFSAEERAEQGRGMCAFQAIGRLREGVSVAQAREELQGLYASYLDTHPDAREFTAQTGQTYGVAPLTTWVRERSSGSMLVSLQVAAGIVLLLGCLNIAGLLLVRSHQRLREVALRSALGASRGRIARQLAMETLVLFLGGGTAAVGIAVAALQVLPRHFRLHEIMPYGQTASFDGNMLTLTLGLALVTGLFTGSLPILYATRRNLGGILQALSHQSTGAPGRRWTQSVFVVAQVALALVLLTAAGVTVRNLRNVFAAGFGVRTDHRLVASVALPAYRYGADFPATMEKINPFKERALERIRALPGVVSASVANRVPLSSDWPSKFGFQVPGYQPAPGESPAVAFIYEVFPDYFQTLGMPLIRGREFAATDNVSAPPVTVISRAIAERFFGERNPVGERIAFYGRESEIVGVVDETQNVPFSLGNAPALYFAAAQWPVFNDEAVFVVHTALPTDALASSVSQALTTVDPLLSVRITNLERLQEIAVLTQSAPMEIAGMFAGLAILLSALGLYGVLASTVAQRTKELGVRIALGAEHRTIFRLVLMRGGVLALVGTLIGLLAAVPVLHWLEPLLVKADATRPDILLFAAGLILVVTLLASFLPARRAAQVDPIIALRHD